MKREDLGDQVNSLRAEAENARAELKSKQAMVYSLSKVGRQYMIIISIDLSIKLHLVNKAKTRFAAVHVATITFYETIP